MEPYIQISFLNDFIFCPRSIYFHQVYKNYDSSLYHEDIQVKGRLAHLNIDNKKYSTKKEILQGLSIYSVKYSLCGRIDLFNKKTGVLTERKKRVVKIYDGFIFQMYAQYYCLIEMGYNVNKMLIYSLDNNKNYPVLLPTENPAMDTRFKNLLKAIDDFKLSENFTQNIKKCKKCIYNGLCDYGVQYAQSS